MVFVAHRALAEFEGAIINKNCFYKRYTHKHRLPIPSLNGSKYHNIVKRLNRVFGPEFDVVVLCLCRQRVSISSLFYFRHT